MQIEEGSRGYMHYCKIEMYADRAGGICTMQGWYVRAGGICTMQGWGWYKILGRSESLAVKKPSNRGGCDACSGAHCSPTRCIGSQTDFITTSWKSTRVKGNNKMNNTKQCQL